MDARKPRENVARLCDSMGPYSNYIELYLIELSKSLTDQVYTWYLSPKPGSIQDWDDIISTFNTKFFCREAKYTLPELGRTSNQART